jgi:FixJ family two-component response regulator
MTAASAIPVAIIDDDEGLCRSMGRLVRQWGFRPLMFFSAEDFLDCPERAAVRCLLLDIQLGGMSGIALHQQLLAAGDAPPVIYITGHDAPAVRDEASSTGCAGFFLKSDAGTAIIDTLRRVTAPS